MSGSAVWSPIRRWVVAGVVALAAVSAAFLLAWRESDHAARSAPHPPRAAHTQRGPPPARVAAIPPSFDFVRVAPDGSVVIAGRAAPGGEVTARENGREIGQAQTDPEGAFVIVPAAPLPSGTGELTLSAGPPGKPGRPGTRTVLLMIPPRDSGGVEGGNAPEPLAVLIGADVPRVLQGAGMPRPDRLGLQSLDYGPQGRARFAGTAMPGAQVRLYLDNNLVGEAVAGLDGLWTLSSSGTLQPGRHRLRLDQLGPDKHVASRIRMRFPFEPPVVRDLPPGGMAVEPAAGFWRVAFGGEGSVVHYMIVFRPDRQGAHRGGTVHPGQAPSAPVPEPQAGGGALEPLR